MTTLTQAASVTLDGAGGGEVTFSVPWGQAWTITRCTVSCTADTPPPTAKVYRGSASPANLLGGTYSGMLDAGLSTPGEELVAGELLTVTWEGGDPGAVATATIGGRLVLT